MPIHAPHTFSYHFRFKQRSSSNNQPPSRLKQLIRANEILAWESLFRIFKETFALQGLDPALRDDLVPAKCYLYKTKLNKRIPD